MSILSRVPKAVVCLTASIVFVAVPSFGQVAVQGFRPAPAVPVAVPDSSPAATAVVPDVTHAPPKRPAALVPLDVTFAALQALDVHSTLRARAYGGREGNPVVAGLVNRPALFIALKGTTAASLIYLTEKLWKRNRTAAVLTMIGVNCGYGMVAWHNYSIGR